MNAEERERPADTIIRLLDDEDYLHPSLTPRGREDALSKVAAALQEAEPGDRGCARQGRGAIVNVTAATGGDAMRCNKCDQPTDGQNVLVLCTIRDGHPPFLPEYVGYTWHVACAPIDGL